ncbi:hypothetical protein [Jatrophihabitans sp.]|uniref:hypothetical protein n=1 Tax=Jatrophihabitans sp. TaxID=1932789 RepID=UPI002CDBD626|nr:hypothetical protein [Jatrophihabitans sp.]
MPRILATLAGCSLVVGLLAVPSAGAQPRTVSRPAGANRLNLAHSPGSFQPIHPLRVLDTRSGLGGTRGTVRYGGTVTVNLAAVRPVPADPVSAAVIDVTVPGFAQAGSLSVYPSGTSWDHRVTMSLAGGGGVVTASCNVNCPDSWYTIQQQLTVRLGSDGAITIRSDNSGVFLVVDVLGFYVAGVPSQAGMFAPLHSRVLDTRTGQPLAAGQKITLTLPGHGGIPAGGAGAVVLNIAVLKAHVAGLLGVTDGDGSLATRIRFPGDPVYQNGLMLDPRAMQAERAVKLGPDGTLTFSQSSSTPIHLVVDVVGYFLPGAVTQPGGFVATGPQPLNAGQRIVLTGRTPVDLPVTGIPAGQVSAYDIVVSNDRPWQPALLGLTDADGPWRGSATVSSSPALQPSELTVPAGGTDTVTVRNLFSAPSTWLHAWLTGYYLGS